MNEKQIQELRYILIARPTDELEIMNNLIVDILAVRKEISLKKEHENKMSHCEKERYQTDMI